MSFLMAWLFTLILETYGTEALSTCSNSNFLIPVSLQPDGIAYEIKQKSKLYISKFYNIRFENVTILNIYRVCVKCSVSPLYTKIFLWFKLHPATDGIPLLLYFTDVFITMKMGESESTETFVKSRNRNSMHIEDR